MTNEREPINICTRPKTIANSSWPWPWPWPWPINLTHFTGNSFLRIKNQQFGFPDNNFVKNEKERIKKYARTSAETKGIQVSQ